jgi:hypothetical protein
MHRKTWSGEERNFSSPLELNGSEMTIQFEVRIPTFPKRREVGLGSAEVRREKSLCN